MSNHQMNCHPRTSSIPRYRTGVYVNKLTVKFTKKFIMYTGTSIYCMFTFALFVINNL